ncbi:hypothetical protein A2U01_0067225, partial [Trifolium medium]|nr:hypothetical protein [Trifolium medium]
MSLWNFRRIQETEIARPRRSVTVTMVLLVRGVNEEFESAQMKKKSRMSISNKFFDDETVKTEIWKENLGLLDNDLNMHLKFSLEPKTMFVKKIFVENPA